MYVYTGWLENVPINYEYARHVTVLTRENPIYASTNTDEKILLSDFIVELHLFVYLTVFAVIYAISLSVSKTYIQTHRQKILVLTNQIFQFPPYVNI